MASTFSTFRAPTVSSAALPNPPPRKSTAWWTPVFGWSSEPDYIANRISNPVPLVTESSQETGRVRSDKKIFVGCLTEQKAKELRKKMAETTTFHDIMYHSAIASRLASDLSGCDGR